MSDLRRPRHIFPILWNISVICSIYTLAFVVAHIRNGNYFFWRRWNSPQAIEIGNRHAPAIVDFTVPEVVGDEVKIKVKFRALRAPIRLNRFANVFNRPRSKVQPHDNYLGPRPHVDTEIDFEALMTGCRGGKLSPEQFRNTSRCLEFLRDYEVVYSKLPPQGSRASDRSPRNAEYPDSDGRENTLVSYPTVTSAKPPSKHSRGTCPGPIIPYHVYWRGPATWRVEIFIKAYLYTQNLACSQLHIWLDADPYPNAVADMLIHDRLFARFLPLVDRGDIVLRSWHFPDEISFPELYEELPNIFTTRTAQSSKAPLKRMMQNFHRIVRKSQSPNEIVLSQKEKSFLPVAVSDAVRFVVLHLFGGGYFDMDVLMLRDMRPFYLPSNHSFAERWSTYTNGGFNTAIMSLTANSSLSSYFLRGGIKMGLNFHPLVLGIMSRKDGRNEELQMMEHGLFDPLWNNYAGNEIGPCPVPCFNGDYSMAFKGTRKSVKDEWSGYYGARLQELPRTHPPVTWKTGRVAESRNDLGKRRARSAKPFVVRPEALEPSVEFHVRRRDLHAHQPVDEDFLVYSNIILEYRESADRWPPNNRTLAHFFRGAYTYHIHNQWDSRPEPNSWLSVIEQAHNRFFEGRSTNPYDERWAGPYIPDYPTWAEYI